MIPSINADDFKIANQQGIDNHRKVADYFQTAAKYYLEAVRLNETGNSGRSAQSLVIAHGFFDQALKAQSDDLQHHTTYN